MNHQSSVKSGQCQCGKVGFQIHAKPVFRSICHCQLCQVFNQAPYADITVYRATDVALTDEQAVDFAQSGKAMLQRGKCKSCGKPAIEYLKMPMMPKLTIIPTENIDEQQGLVAPSFHGFYHRRQQDADDNLPKYSGFVSSQMWFMGHAIKGLMKG